MSRYYPPVTVTGNHVNFSAPNGGKLDSVSVQIIPTQDLHGYANPWPGGGGKNLFDCDTTVQAYINASGYETVSPHNAACDYILLKPNTDYCVSCNQTMRNIGTCIFNDTKTSVLSRDDHNNVQSVVISSSANTRYLRAWINVDNSTTMTVAECKKYEPQVEAGNMRTSFAPYANICPISGRTGVSVYRTGKNLLDKANVLQDLFIKPATMKIGAIGDTGASVYCPIKGGETYTVSKIASARFAIATTTDLPANKVSINDYRANNSATSLTIQTTENDKYIVAFVYLASADTGKTQQEILDSVQVEKGSTATTYEPYNGNTYSVDWTTEAGTVYGGTLDVVTGGLTVDRASVDLGTLNWSMIGSTNKYFQSDALIGSIKPPVNSSTLANAICEEYKCVTWSDPTYESGRFAVNGDVQNPALRGKISFINTNYASAADFKTAMSGIKLVYELATPLTYQLTPKQIAALIDQNYIWSSNNETISVVYALLVPGSDKYTLIVNGVDIADFVERDSYRTTLYPVFSEAVQTLDGVGHTALLRKKGELSARFNPRTAADTAIICAALLNAPCEVQYHCLQRNADVTALMTIDSVSALYLSRCLYCRQKWNDIDSITLTEL